MSDAEVVLDAVGHRFAGSNGLFSGLSVRLEPGAVYGLVGPSGSGKSTLLGILAGWVTPTEGQVLRRGIRRIGWVFQNPYGVANRTALDHVALPFLANGLSRAEAETRALRKLEAFDLGDIANSRFRDLSGGEAQRLMLARGIAAAPDLFLVDEPTAQLDLRTAATVNASLQAMRREQTIVVVATHDERTRQQCTDVIDLGSFQ